jgi:hypothetical protein
MSLDDVKAYRMQEATKLITRILPLQEWGFIPTAKYFDNNTHPTMIYDSESCRVKILYEALGRYEDHTMMVHYGRLDVPDKASIIVYGRLQSDYHLLWHNVFYAMDFLEGLTPQEAKTRKHTRLVPEFEQSDDARAIRYQPERDLVFHRKIWQTYGSRLFSVFDSRQKELWEQYSTFVKDYWRAMAQP